MKKQFMGDTLEEAVMNAMIDLSLTSEKIKYDIIQEGKSGFLGIGKKKFIIDAYGDDNNSQFEKIKFQTKKEFNKNTNYNTKFNTYKRYENKNLKSQKSLVENSNGVYEFKSKEQFIKGDIQNLENAVKEAKIFLDPILKKFNRPIEIEENLDEENNAVYLNFRGEEIGIIIGKQGSTLNAMQHLVNIYVNNILEKKVKIYLDSEGYRESRLKTLEYLSQNAADIVRKTKKEYIFDPMTSYERKMIHQFLQKEKNIETKSVGTEKDRHVVVRFKRY